MFFKGSDIKISTAGARHLGAALGNSKYKEEYIQSVVQLWKYQLQVLSKIAEIHPQAAYVHGFQHKYT